MGPATSAIHALIAMAAPSAEGAVPRRAERVERLGHHADDLVLGDHWHDDRRRCRGRGRGLGLALEGAREPARFGGSGAGGDGTRGSSCVAAPTISTRVPKPDGSNARRPAARSPSHSTSDASAVRVIRMPRRLRSGRRVPRDPRPRPRLGARLTRVRLTVGIDPGFAVCADLLHVQDANRYVSRGDGGGSAAARAHPCPQSAGELVDALVIHRGHGEIAFYNEASGRPAGPALRGRGADAGAGWTTDWVRSTTRTADPLRPARPHTGADGLPGRLAVLHRSGDGCDPDRGERHPDCRYGRLSRGDGGVLAGTERARLGCPWLDPAPGPETWRYGGTLVRGGRAVRRSTLVLDAGTGIRSLGLRMPARTPDPPAAHPPHLDHIQGLMFFAPMFNPEAEVILWGPAAPEAPLRDRIARYLSPR